MNARMRFCVDEQRSRARRRRSRQRRGARHSRAWASMPPLAASAQCHRGWTRVTLVNHEILRHVQNYLCSP